MTDKFDPNATPLCYEFFEREFSDRSGYHSDGDYEENCDYFANAFQRSFQFAEEQELRARLAEEKLRIAVDALCVARKSFDLLGVDSDEDIEDALREIQRVGNGN